MKMLLKLNFAAIDSSILVNTNSQRLILDVRDPNLYGKSHIKNSTHLLTSNLLLRRLQRGSLTVSSLLPQHILITLQRENNLDSVVIYDEDSDAAVQSRCINIIGCALRKEFPKQNIAFLNGGYAEFCTRYPSFCDFDFPIENPTPFQISINEFCEMNDPTDKNVFSPATDTTPVQILPNLYLGSAQHSSDKELLDRIGVTAILNVSKTCPMFFMNSYEYKNIPVDDTNSENISIYFDEAVQFIDTIVGKHGTVLVHCHAGISRSATICIAYLMRKYQYTLDQAYEYTKKRRAAISPNFNFLGQLLKLESELFEHKENELTCPLTVTLPIIERDGNLKTKAPLTLAPLNKKVQFFSYSPNSCKSFFGSGNMSPMVLTPS